MMEDTQLIEAATVHLKEGTPSKKLEDLLYQLTYSNYDQAMNLFYEWTKTGVINREDFKVGLKTFAKVWG